MEPVDEQYDHAGANHHGRRLHEAQSVIQRHPWGSSSLQQVK